MAEYGMEDNYDDNGNLIVETTDVTLERILDKIAEEVITSPYTNISPFVVKQNQKTIRNGIVTIGRLNSEKLILFQKDTKANAEDLIGNYQGETLTSIVNTLNSFDVKMEYIFINITPVNSSYTITLQSQEFNYDLTSLLSEISTEEDGTTTVLNPVNVSQFLNIEQQQTTINPEQANEFLDTNIYELLPDALLRQQQIDNLFTEINNLLPDVPTLEDFGIGDDPFDNRVDRNESQEWIGSEEYYLNNSITAPQENPNLNTIDEEGAYITRLDKNINTANSGKTIESLRNRLNDYLKDIDEEAEPIEDERPEYKNESSGYLKFRNLNQGIIIRNTSEKFIEGLDPNNPAWLVKDGTDLDFSDMEEMVTNAGTGFTISMWVRFLDKTSSGTLFNYGNPTREENPFGFKLETYMVDRDDPTVDGTSNEQSYANFGEFVDANDYLNNTLGLFQTTNTERFVRLQVREFGDTTSTSNDLGLRDSHVGNPTLSKLSVNPPELNDSNQSLDDLRLLSTTLIPQDFNEWYFICATYNPSIIEPNDDSNRPIDTAVYSQYKNNKDFWMNHIDPEFPTQSKVNSGYGNKCKVEIISRTDLLRARGYKV